VSTAGRYEPLFKRENVVIDFPVDGMEVDTAAWDRLDFPGPITHAVSELEGYFDGRLCIEAELC